MTTKTLNRTQQEVLAAGVPASGQFQVARFGPFTLAAQVPDNAVAPVDLRTAAALHDAQLNALGATGANPPIILVITGYRYRIEAAGEAEAIQRAAIANQFLHHEPISGNNRDIMLAPGMGTVSEQAGFATTVAATTLAASCIAAKWAKLKNPMVVDLEREVFEMRQLAAVNFVVATAGTGILELEGYALPNNLGIKPEDLSCMSEAELGKFARGSSSPVGMVQG